MAALFMFAPGGSWFFRGDGSRSETRTDRCKRACTWRFAGMLCWAERSGLDVQSSRVQIEPVHGT